MLSFISGEHNPSDGLTKSPEEWLLVTCFECVGWNMFVKTCQVWLHVSGVRYYALLI